MKIVQLATSLKGGAGNAAFRMNNALNIVGEESTFIHREGVFASKLEDSRSPNVDFLKKIESSAVTLFQSKLVQKNNDLVTPFSISTFNTKNDLLNQADVIHIHAYYNFLSHNSLRKIVALGKPTFFTLHDQRFFTGGCHYSRGCKKFQDNCASCPQVSKYFGNSVKTALSNQRDVFESCNNVELVSPSKWLADLARNGIVSRHLPLHVLRNPIPRIFFEMISPARKNLGDMIRIAFIAANLQNPYKDLTVFREAINDYSRETSRKICVVLVGHGVIPEFEQSIKVEAFHPNNDFEMAKLLGTIDLVVVPSNQDNSPSVIGEALATGVPVIGSDSGGIPELLKDFDMPVFPVGEARQLTHLISRWNYSISNGDIRKKARDYFSEERIGSDLVRIYKELVEKLSKLN